MTVKPGTGTGRRAEVAQTVEQIVITSSRRSAASLHASARSRSSPEPRFGVGRSAGPAIRQRRHPGTMKGNL